MHYAWFFKNAKASKNIPTHIFVTDVGYGDDTLYNVKIPENEHKKKKSTTHLDSVSKGEELRATVCLHEHAEGNA